MACTEIRLFNEKIIEEKSLQNFEINFCEKYKKPNRGNNFFTTQQNFELQGIH